MAAGSLPGCCSWNGCCPPRLFPSDEHHIKLSATAHSASRRSVLGRESNTSFRLARAFDTRTCSIKTWRKNKVTLILELRRYAGKFWKCSTKISTIQHSIISTSWQVFSCVCYMTSLPLKTYLLGRAEHSWISNRAHIPAGYFL